jgi:hypothetical protein
MGTVEALPVALGAIAVGLEGGLRVYVYIVIKSLHAKLGAQAY